MSSQSCCPENSIGFLAPSYSTKGSTNSLSPNNYDYYSVGNPSVKKAILIIPDIYGWNGGRTRNVADYFATLGYYVVVPKLLQPAMEGAIDDDGHADVDFNLEYVKGITWEEVLKPRLVAMVEHLTNVGIEKSALIGFCWGGWIMSYMLSSELADSFVCGAIAHPSIILEQYIHGREPTDLVAKVTKPMLLMPTQNDSDMYREGGELYKVLLIKNPTSATVDFPTVTHGFVPRGDISIPGMQDE
eukprot:gene39400-51934_t